MQLDAVRALAVAVDADRNTWCTQNSCGVDWCTSAEVLDVAQTIKDLGMQEYGYDHINLDDCWGTRDNVTGAIEGDPTRFPEGMKAFIAKVNALGFDFGLYTDIGVHACHSPFVGSYGHYKQDAQTFADWNVSFVKFDGCVRVCAVGVSQSCPVCVSPLLPNSPPPTRPGPNRHASCAATVATSHATPPRRTLRAR